MGQYILAHDLGTTGDKATLYNQDGEMLNSAFSGYETFYPRTGWVEQDPRDWWDSVCLSTKKLVEDSGINKDEIGVISFSGQMMGCLPVGDKGEPLRRSIIWADQRSVKQANSLKDSVGEEEVYRVTGHRVSPTYSLAKIMWVMENEPRVYEDCHKFLHAKDYIINKLTGKFVTDHSDASGMNLYNIKKKSWSPKILKAANLDPNKLPEVRSSFDVIGEVAPEAASEIGLNSQTPVVVGSGDGTAASVGAAVVDERSAYNYIGSSSWIALATREPILDPEKKTFNWIHMDPDMYVPCGTMQSAGASYNWLKETLCRAEKQLSDKLDLDVYDLMNLSIEDSKPGAHNLLFLPYLQGERSPHWNPNAKGAFIGITINHSRKDIIRSVMEGVSFNLKIIGEALEKETDFTEIRLIGGGAKSETWAQILADVYGKRVEIPEVIEEATSLGAAIAGGVGVGIFDSIEVSKKLNPTKKEVSPRDLPAKKYGSLYPIFKESYHSLVKVFDHLSKLED